MAGVRWVTHERVLAGTPWPLGQDTPRIPQSRGAAGPRCGGHRSPGDGSCRGHGGRTGRRTHCLYGVSRHPWGTGRESCEVSQRRARRPGGSTGRGVTATDGAGGGGDGGGVRGTDGGRGERGDGGHRGGGGGDGGGVTGTDEAGGGRGMGEGVMGTDEVAGVGGDGGAGGHR